MSMSDDEFLKSIFRSSTLKLETIKITMLVHLEDYSRKNNVYQIKRYSYLISRIDKEIDRRNKYKV